MNKIIYTTGITGFIGNNLLGHLLGEYDNVANFTRQGTIQLINNQKTCEENISENFFIQHPPHCLINLATLYKQFPESSNELNNLVESNILFPSKVISALEKFKDLKIINVLSYTQLLKLPEQNVYSLSKELFKKYLDHHFNSVVNVYLFDTFGSGDTRNKVTDVFIKNILARKSIIIPSNEININLSECNQVSKSLLRSINLDPGSYAIKSPDTISLEILATLIMEILNIKVEIIKTSHATDYLKTIQTFPENIFTVDDDCSLKITLSKRIQEIKNEIEVN